MSANAELAELLDFVEARAAEDEARICTLCPYNAHMPEVGAMARIWAERIRQRGANPTRLETLTRIASLHRDHPHYSPAWR